MARAELSVVKVEADFKKDRVGSFGFAAISVGSLQRNNR